MNSKIILIAACSAALLVSCNKGGDTTPQSLPTPAQDKAACTITPKSSDAPEIKVNGKTLYLNKVVFLRSGRYSIETVVERKIVPNSTKADSPTNHIVFTGTYTENNGVYTLSGDISTTMTVNASAGTIQSDILTATVQVIVIPGNVDPGTLEDLLYRSWTIKTFSMNVNNGAIEMSWDFTDSKNVSIVAAYLKKKEIKIDVAKFSKYDVKEISFGKDNVTVSFADNSVSDFSGTFSVSGTVAKALFNYNLSDVLPEDNPFINAQASGYVSFQDNDIVMSMVVSTSELQGTVQLTLKAAN